MKKYIKSSKTERTESKSPTYLRAKKLYNKHRQLMENLKNR